MNVPSKFYVARQFRSTEEILGFMVPADKEHTKAFEKRKLSADKWAGNSLPAIYITNEPKTGYSLVTNKSRYSTSNVVWRIRHPEGFEFEITSPNMCDLLANNTIVKGVFQEPLFFNESRELINENTSTFTKDKAANEKAEQIKEAMKALEPGMAFRVEDRKGNKTVYSYLGKFHFICNGLNNTNKIPEKSTLLHVVQNLSTKEFFVKNDMKFEFIRMDHEDVTVDRPKIIDEMRIQFRNHTKHARPMWSDSMDENRTVLAVADKPFKRDEMSVHWESIKVDDMGVMHDNFVYKYNNNSTELRVFGFMELYSNGYNHYTQSNKYVSDKISSACFEMFGYPCELNENMMPVLDLDISEHTGFGYYGKSPFATPCKSYYPGQHGENKKKLTVLNRPVEIEVGYFISKGE